MKYYRTRYKEEDVINSQFYQLPKFLFTKEFEEMSNDAKIMYALLKDRHELSIKNRWVDKNGYIYLNYTRKDLSNILKCGKNSVVKYINELKYYGLIEEERVGFNQVNRIYLTEIGSKTYVKPSNRKESQKVNLRVPKSKPQESQKVTPNKTNLNNNNTSKNKSVCPVQNIEQSFEQKTETDRQTDIDIKNDLLDELNINLKNNKKKDSSIFVDENLKNYKKNSLSVDVKTQTEIPNLKIDTSGYPLNFIKQYFKFNELISQLPILDEVFAELHKILNYKSQTIKIGAKIPDEDIEIFKQKLMKLTPADMQEVVNEIEKVVSTEEVKYADLLIRTKIHYQFKSSIKALSKGNAKRKPKKSTPTANQVPQELNYEQREYSEEYLNSFYENYWDKHIKPE